MIIHHHGNLIRRASLFIGVLSLCAFGHAENFEGIRLSSPSENRPAMRNVKGLSIIPNGRLLTPLGRQIVVPPHPFGLRLSPNGRILAAVSGGMEPVAVTLITHLDQEVPYVRQIPPGVETDNDVLPAAFMGLAFSPDSSRLYVSGGDRGNIVVFDVAKGKKIGAISLNTKIGDRRFVDSFIGEIAATRDGGKLYAVDQANFRLVIVDLKTPPQEEKGLPGSVVGSVQAGRYPFAVALSPDEKTAYVANAGMFEYSVMKGINPQKKREWLAFPPFGFNTPEMREGIKIGEYEIPGLGDPNAPESFSIWRIDLSQPAQEKVTGKVKTGVLVGEKVNGLPACGGSNPNSVAVDDRFIYVSNGSNDTVSVLDAESFQVIATIPLGLKEALGPLRGQIPFGLKLTPNHQRLYVAEAGINAVAVIDSSSRKVLGHIPTAWFPSKVETNADGSKLYVSCAKGYGAGPNGGRGFVQEPDEEGIGNLMKGVVCIMDAPKDAELPALTQRVIDNLVKTEKFQVAQIPEPHNPIPPYPGAFASPIKHVVYITKENRTYDQVFGDYEKADGDPTLAAFGLHATATADGQPKIEDVNVMPNHQALARRYALCDNFYCDSDHSADGHRWLVGTFPNVWTETSTKTSPRREAMFSSAPGRRLMTGSSGAIYPEDYNEAGSIWEHLNRNGKEFFNYGLGFEFAGSDEDDYPDTGIRLGVNYPMPEPLYRRTSRNFATFNTAVPDQIRVNAFEKEFKEKWLSGKEPFPPVVTMMLPNDHGSKSLPARGYPYIHSYMADNDLALGRVIELFSQSPWWKETAVFVTEDDAQGGQDHVDHHRSILMVIGPNVKKGRVCKTHASFGSILKTIELILGIPYLNQFDATASDLSDCFTSETDPAPYRAIPPDPRIFNPQKALDTYKAEFAWKPAGEGREMDNPEFTKQQRKELQPSKP